ncbi:hypothetical protein HY641_01235 [Candidatus Woesearchaeota archaeon]|nr:hypothetical protein [Candidatus Woesearchaeota archaeon]
MENFESRRKGDYTKSSRRYGLAVSIILILASSVFADSNIYERPKVRSIADNPILNGKTVDLTPTSEKAWLSKNVRAHSIPFKKPRGKVDMTSKIIAAKPKAPSTFNSLAVRNMHKTISDTFVGEITGGPGRKSLNVRLWRT